MQIWPAIDLRGGKCVRLEQGDFSRETVFGNDPVAVARHWVAEGAAGLHLVDLDAARDAAPRNREHVRSIVQAAGVPCQMGGGVRDEAAIDELLACGVDRLVIGSAALQQTDWFRSMCRRFPGRLVLGIDARDGMVAIAGWTETSRQPAVALAKDLACEPLAAIVYTDIATDGMLSGPNVEAMAEMQQSVSVPVIASGGVTTARDVADLARIPMAGCIIGRALYEGALSVKDALRAAAQPDPH